MCGSRKRTRRRGRSAPAARPWSHTVQRLRPIPLNRSLRRMQEHHRMPSRHPNRSCRRMRAHHRMPSRPPNRSCRRMTSRHRMRSCHPTRPHRWRRRSCCFRSSRSPRTRWRRPTSPRHPKHLPGPGSRRPIPVLHPSSHRRTPKRRQACCSSLRWCPRSNQPERGPPQSIRWVEQSVRASWTSFSRVLPFWNRVAPSDDLRGSAPVGSQRTADLVPGYAARSDLWYRLVS